MVKSTRRRRLRLAQFKNARNSSNRNCAGSRTTPHRQPPDGAGGMRRPSKLGLASTFDGPDLISAPRILFLHASCANRRVEHHHWPTWLPFRLTRFAVDPNRTSLPRKFASQRSIFPQPNGPTTSKCMRIDVVTVDTDTGSTLVTAYGFQSCRLLLTIDGCTQNASVPPEDLAAIPSSIPWCSPVAIVPCRGGIPHR